MKVILTEDVGGLGDIGETVTVKPGYARNFLIPRGKALEAEARNAKQVKHTMLQIEAKKRKLRSEFQAVAERIRELTAQFQLKVNASGRVFGSIGTKDIADKLTSMGFTTDRRKVTLTEPLKKIGTHFVKIRLHPEVEVQLKVAIEATEASKEDEEKAVKTAKAQIEEATATE
jgi:large subunit ribosomal protein L9